ncbi:MAG: 30S ribosomal protein S6 [Clostridia bacterium]|nr:30S ribosomal protein S6 [Clostridia bacterium]
MRAYELIYIIKPLEEEATTAVVDKFKGLIENNGGEIVKLDKWGKRKMAYEINDFKEGFYILCNFKGEAAVAQELDRVLKITDEVIKHLIVKEEE